MQGRNRWNRKGGTFDAEPLLKARAVSSVIKGPDLSGEACVTCTAAGCSYCTTRASNVLARADLVQVNKTHTHCLV